MSEFAEQGWVAHRGGGCPVGANETVEIETRAGTRTLMRAGAVVWRYGAFILEIMDPMPSEAEIVRYRMVQPESAA